MTTQPPSTGAETTIAAVRQRRQARYSRQMFGILIAAFTLSVVHTVYAWVADLENPDFSVRSPVTWIFYAVAFGMAAMALRSERWAQWLVQVYLAAVLAIGVFVYPQTFEPRQQTVFGWFENDVYVGLLFLATYLGILRLRRGELTD
jgi:peptidoglycan/LPS O-acetylase OafA/YrhL